MTQRLFFGAPVNGALFSVSPLQADDAGVFVPLVATTEVWVPNSWWGEATVRTATVLVNSNAGVECRLTPILDGVPLDGVATDQDSRVTFTIPTPDSAGRRVIVRPKLGLFTTLRLDGVVYGRSALRGTYLQFLLETLAAPTLPAGESVFDLRFDGVELDYTPKGATAPTVAP